MISLYKKKIHKYAYLIKSLFKKPVLNLVAILCFPLISIDPEDSRWQKEATIATILNVLISNKHPFIKTQTLRCRAHLKIFSKGLLKN